MTDSCRGAKRAPGLQPQVVSELLCQLGAAVTVCMSL
jgi:hypothetical protein